MKVSSKPDYYYYYYNIRSCRHSNVNCDDDAASCVREASIKFADQNRDGPFDLILYTGRTSLARDCQTFAKLLRMKTKDDVKKMCRADPQWLVSYSFQSSHLLAFLDSSLTLTYHYVILKSTMVSNEFHLITRLGWPYFNLPFFNDLRYLV